MLIPVPVLELWRACGKAEQSNRYRLNAVLFGRDGEGKCYAAATDLKTLVAAFWDDADVIQPVRESLGVNEAPVPNFARLIPSAAVERAAEADPGWRPHSERFFNWCALGEHAESPNYRLSVLCEVGKTHVTGEAFPADKFPPWRKILACEYGPNAGGHSFCPHKLSHLASVVGGVTSNWLWYTDEDDGTRSGSDESGAAELAFHSRPYGAKAPSDGILRLSRTSSCGRVKAFGFLQSMQSAAGAAEVQRAA